MELMELFQAVGSQPAGKWYDGIQVQYDNACYPAAGGKADEYLTGSDWFIVGPLDTGFSGSKSVTYSQYSNKTPSNANACLREFNDIADRCRDYWGMTNASEGVRTVNIVGRYIYASIPKAKAANMYMYIMVDGERKYLYKGKNVND